MDPSQQVGSSQKSESTHQSTKDCPGTEAQTEDQKDRRKRKQDDTRRAKASEAEKTYSGTMKRNLDVTQGAKAGSDVDNVDFGTKEHGARDMDALHQVLECQEQELTKLLTSFDLASDGSHHQRAHCFHDDWMSKKKSKCTKTAPQVQTDGSDNDHKADSANPSFLAALPLSELHNLLLSWGKSGDGDHRVLEDRLIECHRQEQGLPSGSDHSNSDEDEVDALDPSEAGGTSKKRFASGGETFDARDPRKTGQDRGASTKVFLPPPAAL